MTPAPPPAAPPVDEPPAVEDDEPPCLLELADLTVCVDLTPVVDQLLQLLR